MEFPVVRINRPLSGPWGSFRYLRNLTRKIMDLKPDGMVVFGLREEAWTIAKSLGGRIPFVIRISQNEFSRTGLPNKLGARDEAALAAAEKILVESQSTAETLQSLSTLSPDRIQAVPDGIEIGSCYDRSIARQTASRIAISNAHPMLMIDPTQPLVVCGSPLTGDEGLLDLIEAWQRVADRFPRARLWILGDGHKSRDVWEKILENNLVNSAIMPGSFDDLSDVFHAADVYVHPLRSDQVCGIMTRALAAGVCPVVTSTQATYRTVEHEVSGIVVGSRSPSDLADTLIRTLDDQDLRCRLGRAAWQSASKSFDSAPLLTHFLDPLQIQTIRSDTSQCELSESLPSPSHPSSST